MTRTNKLTILALGICASASLAGCGQPNPTDHSPTEDTATSVTMVFQIGGGQSITSATYTVTGPH
ncbi:MAG TPA: hypothetical protein VIV60_13205, partial [Polyangiaceae bacterium]